jgi:hypothetical protein
MAASAVAFTSTLFTAVTLVSIEPVLSVTAFLLDPHTIRITTNGSKNPRLNLFFIKALLCINCEF